MSAGTPSAVLFPGLASTGFDELGRFLVLDRRARSRLPMADDVLGGSLLAGLRAESRDGDDGGDGYGVHAQVATVVTALALAQRAVEEGALDSDPGTALCVGASFGHRALAAFSGALSEADALRYTVGFARVEREHAASLPDDPVTHFVVRVPDEAMDEMLAERARRGEWAEISGRLGTGGYLVSLAAARLDDLVADVRAAGGYSMHTMRPAVHAPRLTPMRATLAAEVLDALPVAAPTRPVLADQDGRAVSTADDVRAMLLDGVDTPLDWPAVVDALAERGVEHLHVAGPDRLFARLRTTTGRLRVVPLDPARALRPPTAPPALAAA